MPFAGLSNSCGTIKILRFAIETLRERFLRCLTGAIANRIQSDLDELGFHYEDTRHSSD